MVDTTAHLYYVCGFLFTSTCFCFSFSFLSCRHLALIVSTSSISPLSLRHKSCMDGMVRWAIY
jgi:hypothetical protein